MTSEIVVCLQCHSYTTTANGNCPFCGERLLTYTKPYPTQAVGVTGGDLPPLPESRPHAYPRRHATEC